MASDGSHTPSATSFEHTLLGGGGFSEKQDLGVHQMVLFCACIYGSVAVGWVLLASRRTRPSGDTYKVALLCVTWASASVGMHVLNKALVTALQALALIATSQMLITVVATAAMSGAQLWTADKNQLLTWLLVPLFFAAMLCSSAYTYMYISLTLLTLVRNLSPLISFPIECAVMPPAKQPKLSTASVIAIIVMLFGALVYGQGLNDLSVIGIGLACLNMIIAVSDRVIQRRLLTNECKDLTSGVCTLVTNFFGAFPSLIMAQTMGEVAAAGQEQKEAWHDPEVLILLCASGVVGLGIGFFGFECQRVLSATSFFVLQNASKIVVVSAGVAFFGDPLTSDTFAGVMLSTAGSFLYGYTQMTMPKRDSDETKPLLKPAQENI